MNRKRIVLLALLIAVVSVVSVFAQEAMSWSVSYNNGADDGIRVTLVEGYSSPITVTYLNAFRYGKVEFILKVYELTFDRAGSISSSKLVKEMKNTELFSMLSGEQYSIRFNTGLEPSNYRFDIVVNNINGKKGPFQ